ncbi:Hypothetical_protein [Hexamita inflata]|uniref:Hypothetical_protein n=2 Tax=Hexamita inflata TaxID=28002 RepID=A0AA86QQU0_9EUKA|nr:Hypothetical protein HINF_LOCUS27253 [Hexamita inflata]CAI9962895.1 Hypothetical protein HINF_LOCUS50540 [Hexamita inflata]
MLVLDNFAVFGFNDKYNNLKDCVINVTIAFSTINSALICIKCDVNIENSTLVYIANGTILSAIMLQSVSFIQINNSNVQYRLASYYSSGIVSEIHSQLIKFQIEFTKMLGFNYIQSEDNGYISYLISEQIIINMQEVNICVDSQQIGIKSAIPKIIGHIVHNCDKICTMDYFVYGLCSQAILFSQMSDYKMMCIFPFEYNSVSCQCSYGYILNNSNCLYVIDALDSLTQQLIYEVSTNYNQLDLLEKQVYYHIQNNFTNLQIQQIQSDNIIESRIIGNYTQQYNNIQQNYTKLENYINVQYQQLNTQVLNSINIINLNLQGNRTILENLIKQNIDSISMQLQADHSRLQIQILNNISEVNYFIQSNFDQTNTVIQTNYVKADQQLNDITAKLNNNILKNQNELNTKLVQNQDYANEQIALTQTNMNQQLQDLLKEVERIYLQKVDYKC